MPYFLRCDGVNDGVNIGLPDTTSTFILKIIPATDPADYVSGSQYFYDARQGGGTGYMGQSGALSGFSSQIGVVTLNGVAQAGNNAYAVFDNAVAGDVIGIDIGSAHSGALRLFSKNNATGAKAVDVQRVEIWDSTDSTKLDEYDFDRSTGNSFTSSILGNTATLVNFPTDDSQWISSGGGGLTVTLPTIDSSNSFGVSEVYTDLAIGLPTVDAANSFNVTAIIKGLSITPPTIDSANALDVSEVVTGLVISPTGIASVPSFDVVVAGSPIIAVDPILSASSVLTPTVGFASYVVLLDPIFNVNSIPHLTIDGGEAVPLYGFRPGFTPPFTPGFTPGFRFYTRIK